MHNKCSTKDNDHQLRPEVNGGSNGFMLFGVRVMEGSFRKSFSMNNLAQYDEQTHQESNNGYVSDDVVHPSGRTNERKRGVPWSEEEHKLFLLGLQGVGKGDWRGISRKFVKTRTPTQVASHAQKYFLRRNNYNRRRRRSSLFDITTEAVQNEEQMHQESLTQIPTSQTKQLNMNVEMLPPTSFATAVTPFEPLKREIIMPQGQVNKPMRPLPNLPLPPSSKMANLNLRRTLEPPSLSLNLSMSLNSPPPSNQDSTYDRHARAFEALSGGGEDSSISVA